MSENGMSSTVSTVNGFRTLVQSLRVGQYQTSVAHTHVGEHQASVAVSTGHSIAGEHEICGISTGHPVGQYGIYYISTGHLVGQYGIRYAPRAVVDGDGDDVT
eukprot:1511953-Rhodomonas_salina.3